MSNTIVTPGRYGTSWNACWASPSDQIGSPENILSRLDALWAEIQRLDAANIQAGLASSMTESMGVMHDFELLAGEGWPGDYNYTGMTMSTTPLPIAPEERRVVAYMNNGREIYGYDGIQTLEGDFTSSGSAVFVSTEVTSPGSFEWVEYKADPIAATVGGYIELHADGVYMLNARCVCSRPAGTGAGDALFSVGQSGYASPLSHMQVSAVFSADVPAMTPYYAGSSLLWTFKANDLLAGKLEVQDGLAVLGSMILSITKLPSDPPVESGVTP